MSLFSLARCPYRLTYRLLGCRPTTIGRHRFKCDPHHVGFWRQVSRRSWEPETFAIFDRFLTPSSVVCDVGAWIGPTTIYAARLCRQVISFEPDPVSFFYLLWNIRLNKLTNVLPVNAAIHARDGLVPLAGFGRELGTTMTSLIPNPRRQLTSYRTRALAFTWSSWLEQSGCEHPSFIKMDIEGGEFQVLPLMREYLEHHRPILYLSTHLGHLHPAERPSQADRLLGGRWTPDLGQVGGKS